MKNVVRILTSLLFIFAVVLIILLNNTKNDTTAAKIDIPSLKMVTVFNNKNSDIYNIENYELRSLGSFNAIRELVYNSKKSVYVYSTDISKGNNLIKSSIQILNNGKTAELNDFYSAEDLKLNPSGSRIAFRKYRNDSVQSAEGMCIYDIYKNKYINLNSDVLVSGNLYEWLDDNHILYYGIKSGKDSSSKIYMYDLNNKKESIYCDKIDGYCIYFKLLEGNLFILSRQTNGDNFYYYNNLTNKVSSVKGSMISVYDSVFDKKDDELYLLATEDGGHANLYKFSPKNLEIDKVSYDFPKYVNLYGGIACDNGGNVFFTGSDLLNSNNDKYSVFVYLKGENSINLISDEDGTYKIYHDNH